MKKEEETYLIYYYIPGQENLEVYFCFDVISQMVNNSNFLLAHGVPHFVDGVNIDYSERIVWLNKANIIEIIELK